MNKIAILIIAFFCSSIIYSQDIESLKNHDTIYLVLKHSIEREVQDFKTFTFSASGNNSLFEFNFREKADKHKIVNITTELKHKPIKVCNKKNQFIEENKKNIIDISLIEKYGTNKLFNEILQVNKLNKVFYVIDEKELKKRKIHLKKARVFAVGYIEM
ncbi:hypothetical protein ABS768_14420 [Flavobacterium sp. ST-75]|uniref:Uncharacterized protein n=1 Tax=Flavobacterium rhizophilum TaxID=3163296 RepID=A0ABW8YF76_9FLAO